MGEEGMMADWSRSLRALQRSGVAEQHQAMIAHFKNMDKAAPKLQGDKEREEFLERAYPGGGAPPGLLPLRVIDCVASDVHGSVVLVDWIPSMPSYTAISHTFGLPVYKAFDCPCAGAAISSCSRPRHAAAAAAACRDAGHAAAADDILRMTRLLRRAAGSDYIWHDGVCIAQHDEPELRNYLQHMGWVYATARETAIFLHYVGAPMAAIRHSPPLAARWQERVWTLQECALSRRRRFCVRVGDMDRLRSSADLPEFEQNLASWYDDATSTVEAVPEETFWDLLVSFYEVLMRLIVSADPSTVDAAVARKAAEVWYPCLTELFQTVLDTCFLFPTMARALEMCSSRDSKHEGDRINSILTLAGVRGFVAPRDEALEDSTIEFFKRLGQRGLAISLFTGSIYSIISAGAGAAAAELPPSFPRWEHSWPPLISKPLRCTNTEVDLTPWLKFEVIAGGDGHQNIMRLEGDMTCVSVRMKVCKEGEILSHRWKDDAAGKQEQRRLCQCLEMDLRYDLPMFRASAAPGSTTKELSHGQLSNLLDFGLAVLPSFDFANPIVNGRRIEFGEDIYAYLVIPSSPLIQLHVRSEPPPPPDDELVMSLPGLLLQGDLRRSTTKKIGCFHVFHSLRSIILSPPCQRFVTHLDRVLVH